MLNRLQKRNDTNRNMRRTFLTSLANDDDLSLH